MTPRRTTPKPAQTKLQDTPTDTNPTPIESNMLDQLERLEGGPVVDGTPVVLGDSASEEVTPDGVPLPAADLTGVEPDAFPPPWTCDTFAILTDGGQHFLDGPVPVHPVLFAGPLVQWLSTGACPWGDMDAEHLVLRLANIALEFTVGETLDNGSVVLTPGAHLWTEDASWHLYSDGTEAAAPRG